MFGVTRGLGLKALVDLPRKKHHVEQTIASGGTDFLLLINVVLIPPVSRPLSGCLSPNATRNSRYDD